MCNNTIIIIVEISELSRLVLESVIKNVKRKSIANTKVFGNRIVTISVRKRH